MMYACQAVAYNARDQLGGHKTDSTSTTPPTHTVPDLSKLCDLKK